MISCRPGAMLEYLDSETFTPNEFSISMITSELFSNNIEMVIFSLKGFGYTETANSFAVSKGNLPLKTYYERGVGANSEYNTRQ